MKRLLRILCTMVIVFNIINASPKLYLYLLPFENINDEKVIAWLGSGFTDMLTKELNAIDGLFLRNRDDLENIMKEKTQQYDLIIIMGAGDINKLSKQLLRNPK